MAIRLMPGDCRQVLPSLPAESVHCVVTSPPYYGLRDYGTPSQLGLEATPAEYIASMVAVFREVRRVLRADGTLWLNMGDSYANPGHYKGNPGDHGTIGRPRQADVEIVAPHRYSKTAEGLKNKDLIGVPWMLAFALRDDGWYLRSDIIWSKPNPMPESVTDRPTKAHEYVFLLSKSARYFYDADAIREEASENTHGRGNGIGPKNGATEFGLGIKHNSDYASRINAIVPNRNKRSVWEIATEPFPNAHFATYPTALVEPCIKAGCPVGGTVLDPFAGAGTTGLVADRLGRDAILIELNPCYAEMAQRRIYNDAPLLHGVPFEPTPVISDKQGRGGRTYAGFNERWDAREACPT